MHRIYRIFVLNRLAPIAGILPLVSPESAFPAAASRPGNPVYPVHPCFLSFLLTSMHRIIVTKPLAPEAGIERVVSLE